MPKYEEVVIANGNTPHKDFLLEREAQANALIHFLKERPRLPDTMALQEMYTGLRQPLGKKAGLKLVNGINDYLPNNRIGNSILQVKTSDIVDSHILKLDWHKKKHGLNFPTVLDKRQFDNFKKTTVGGHLPTRGDISEEGYELLVEQLCDYLNKIRGPLAVSCDWNRPAVRVHELLNRYLDEPMWLAASGDVQHIFVRDYAREGTTKAKKVTHGWHRRIGDHRYYVEAHLTPIKTSPMKRCPVG